MGAAPDTALPGVARSDTAFPTTPPELGAPEALSLPPTTTRVLDNGLRLVVVRKAELPEADFLLVVGSGNEANPPGRSGLARFTASLLTTGTTTRSALQIADQEAYLGARLGASSGWDASTISLHVPTAQLDSALALFADVALRPAFAPKEMERLRSQWLTSLVQLRDRGPAIADRAFAGVLYGAENPYGQPVTGTENAARAVTRAEVERFYRTYYRPNNATLVVVGDVEPADVARRAEALFGAWQRDSVPATAVARPPALTGATIYLIDKPGAPQSSVRIGSVGVPRATPDYFPLLVANTILGGSFTSRLNQNLRETHGYTYGAGSAFDMRRAAGPFVARAEIVAGKTDSALVEFLRELSAIRDTVPAAELARAKRYLQLQLPGDFETTTDVARQLVPLVLYRLPLDFYDTYVQRIGAVTQADVQRVARQYIDPARLDIVIVGDRATIEERLRALGVAPVVVRTIPGGPGAPGSRR